MCDLILVPQGKMCLSRCWIRWPNTLENWKYSNLEIYSLNWDQELDIVFPFLIQPHLLTSLKSLHLVWYFCIWDIRVSAGRNGLEMNFFTCLVHLLWWGFFMYTPKMHICRGSVISLLKGTGFPGRRPCRSSCLNHWENYQVRVSHAAQDIGPRTITRAGPSF